jgi:hypothetical protein
MNKKAAGKELLYFFATLFVIILLVLFFLISRFFSPSISDAAESSLVQKEGLISFLAFLNTKTEIEGQSISMADLARLAQINESYQKKLKEESGKIFDIYGENVYFVASAASPRFYLEVLTTPLTIPRIGEENIFDFTIPSHPNLRLFFGIGEKYKK